MTMSFKSLAHGISPFELKPCTMNTNVRDWPDSCGIAGEMSLYVNVTPVSLLSLILEVKFFLIIYCRLAFFDIYFKNCAILLPESGELFSNRR